MKITPALVLVSLLILTSCSKENANPSKGYILAGENGNINSKVFSPVKTIQVVTGSASFEAFDFNKNGSDDLFFSSNQGYPNADSKSILVNTEMGGGHVMYMSDAPINLNDKISDSQNWVRLTADYFALASNDSFKNDYSTPKYFGFKLSEDNRASWVYGWVKIGINDYNQLQIYSYSCGG